MLEAGPSPGRQQGVAALNLRQCLAHLVDNFECGFVRGCPCSAIALDRRRAGALRDFLRRDRNPRLGGARRRPDLAEPRPGLDQSRRRLGPRPLRSRFGPADKLLGIRGPQPRRRGVLAIRPVAAARAAGSSSGAVAILDRGLKFGVYEATLISQPRFPNKARCRAVILMQISRKHRMRTFGLRAIKAIVVPAAITAAVALIAMSRPWAQTAGITARVFDTLHGLHIAGYQGWFDCPGDGAGLGWGHWARPSGRILDADALAVDMWPDTSELGPDELCATGLHLPSGAPAYLFSDQNPKTVARHFRWMAQYGIDGAAMQRFTAGVRQPAVRRHFDAVLRGARAGAEAARRGFFVMYDISGMNGAAALQVIKSDWPHLVGDLRLTESPSYIFERGRPVVGVWGLGFRNHPVTPAQAAAIIRFLKTAAVPATVLGGVPAAWRDLGAGPRWHDSRTEPQWAQVYRSLDIISPWSVGRYRALNGADLFAAERIVPDLAETRRLGIGYMPVVFPGFSWANGPGRTRHAPLDQIPRRCGEFYRRQVQNAVRAGVDMLYTAMFDEVNEGTAIFKTAASPAAEPARTRLLPLDADRCASATSDMYLRLAGEATRALSGGK